MFVVYKLFFKSSDKVYIGKTYNIKKRISDHIYTATVKCYTNYKDSWIRKHINISNLEYEILYETVDEKDALHKELDFIKYYEGCGYKLVNTQRMVEAGGIRGSFKKLSESHISNIRESCGKDYILINKKGELFECKSLKQFANTNNLNYKNLNSCVRGKSKSSQGFKVFYKKDWDKITDKKYTIESFINYNPNTTKEKLDRWDTTKKEFWILNKNGVIEYGIGITQYCKLMGYNFGNIINTNRYKKPQYGKILFYSLDELNNFKENQYKKFYNVLDETDKKLIFDKMDKTLKFSHERGRVTRELAEHFNCSERRISDIYNKIKKV